MVDAFLKSFTPVVRLGIYFVAGGFLIHLIIIPFLQIIFRLIGKPLKLDLLSLRDKECLLKYSGILVVVGSLIIIIYTIGKYFFNHN